MPHQTPMLQERTNTMLHPIMRIINDNGTRRVNIEISRACGQVDIMLCENYFDDPIVLSNGNLEYHGTWAEYLKYREEFNKVWNAIKEYRVSRLYARAL